MPDLFDEEYDRDAYGDPADDADDEENRDDPQQRDWDDDDETPTVPCPACRQPVADVADRCPHCGEWIIAGAGDEPRRHPWFVIAVVCALLAIGGYVLFCR